MIVGLEQLTFLIATVRFIDASAVDANSFRDLLLFFLSQVEHEGDSALSSGSDFRDHESKGYGGSIQSHAVKGAGKRRCFLRSMN